MLCVLLFGQCLVFVSVIFSLLQGFSKGLNLLLEVLN